MAAKRRGAGKRDYAAEYARRQARAREQGFEGYYQRRTRDSPGAGKPGPAVLAARRGHRGTADFLRSLRDGDLVLCDVTVAERDPGSGLYRRIDKTVIPASGGPSRDYVLRRLSRERLVELIELEIEAGVIFSPSPSMDQRRLVGS